MDDHDDHELTIEYGIRALAEAKKHRTSVEPAAYELWYAHVSGQHCKLSAELSARLEQGELTQRDIEDLHLAHLSSLRTTQALEDVGTKAQSELRAVVEAIRIISGNLDGFDVDLRGISDTLATPEVDAEGLRAALNAVAATAAAMGESNRLLRRKLDEAETNMSALQVALEDTRSEAMTDGLTGLGNRRAFEEQMALRFEAAVAGSLPLSILMLDIDHFKTFNDTHGHRVGDQVIRLVGSSIKQRVGSSDLSARYGGEEFAVICLGRDLDHASALGETIRSGIADYQIVRQGTRTSLGRVTVSVGAACLRPGDTIETLIERADGCLYTAKRCGRNQMVDERALPAEAPAFFPVSPEPYALRTILEATSRAPTPQRPASL